MDSWSSFPVMCILCHRHIIILLYIYLLLTGKRGTDSPESWIIYLTKLNCPRVQKCLDQMRDDSGDITDLQKLKQ